MTARRRAAARIGTAGAGLLPIAVAVLALPMVVVVVRRSRCL